jgi:hypothetical protein
MLGRWPAIVSVMTLAARLLRTTPASALGHAHK